MTAAGIKPSVKEFDDLSDNVREVLEKGLKIKQKQYLADFYKGKSQKNTWIFNTTAMGTWGDDYKRAYWAVWGLGANLTQDAVYGVSQLDSNLKQLKGSDVYKVHFKKGGTPKVGGFWSIATYDNEGYLEANDENRYATGSNMNLTYNKDGSLDIYMSHNKPKGVPHTTGSQPQKRNLKFYLECTGLRSIFSKEDINFLRLLRSTKAVCIELTSTKQNKTKQNKKQKKSQTLRFFYKFKLN